MFFSHPKITNKTLSEQCPKKYSMDMQILSDLFWQQMKKTIAPRGSRDVVLDINNKKQNMNNQRSENDEMKTWLWK